MSCEKCSRFTQAIAFRFLAPSNTHSLLRFTTLTMNPSPAGLLTTPLRTNDCIVCVFKNSSGKNVEPSVRPVCQYREDNLVCVS